MRTLKHAIDYLHLESQLAESEDRFEDYSIALKLLGLLCQGWSTGPGLFNLATAYATGLPHKRYLYRRAERAEFRRLELLRAIPDYDYSREPRMPDRDPMDGRRHYGNDFAKRENRLRNLARQASEADDAIGTGAAHANDTDADFRFGVWATADDRHSMPSRAGARGEPGLPGIRIAESRRPESVHDSRSAH